MTEKTNSSKGITIETDISGTIINCIRFLAADAVEKAKSGHPGMPMGAAPMAWVLWDRFLRHDPGDPGWYDRDRFVLSAGHGSMLLYALLHLSGYDLPLEQLKNFRQWGSITPGHPEYGLTPGVETTTGPLGQGFGNAVGMAIAERHLASIYNRPDFDLVNHFTYVISGDGCLMEGVSQEAASLAGHLGLGRLIVLYDDNGITIDGPTDLAFSENVPARFDAYGWHTQIVEDGNDCESIASAIATAREVEDRPSLISVRTHIAYGAPTKQDSSSAHGAPLGEDELNGAKENLGWPTEPAFYVPKEAEEFRTRALEKGRQLHRDWDSLYAAYKKNFSVEANTFAKAMAGELPDNWATHLPRFDRAMATRAASGQILNDLADEIPQLIGGSADLTPSNNTLIKSSTDFSRDNHSGRNLRFGVREHAMGSVVNGLVLHKGLIPYCGTFLVFSDYMRPAIRLAGLMNIPAIYIFTHDSVGVGEDGPTHQPVEQVAALRIIPNLTVIRPADPNETVGAWKYALQSSGPAALILTRQTVPLIELDVDTVIDGVARGAYIACQTSDDRPDLIIIATGSEVGLSIEAAGILTKKGHHIRIVSMPCWEIFEKQPEEYRNKILPDGIKKLSVEAQITFGWEKWIGASENCIGLNRFGASAPGKVVFEKLGFTPGKIAARAEEIIG